MKTSILGDNSISSLGQVLIETILSLGLSLVIILTGARLLITEWNTWNCSRELFEAVHRARVSDHPGARLNKKIDIEETPASFVGNYHCGNRVHRIELPKVEYAYP